MFTGVLENEYFNTFIDILIRLLFNKQSIALHTRLNIYRHYASLRAHRYILQLLITPNLGEAFKRKKS